MNPAELVNTGLAYIVGVALANLVSEALHLGKPAIALAVGAVVATEVAAWSYQRRKRAEAPFAVKFTVAALIVALCIVLSIISQILWHWMPFPVTTTVIAALGSFAVAMIMFGRLQKMMAKSGRRN
jgi:hypothetical protein